MNFRILLATCLAFPLAGCSFFDDGSAIRLSPQELLDEASLTVRELSAVSFDGDADFAVEMKGGFSVEGTGDFSGSMSDFGKQVSLVTTTKFAGSDPKMQIKGNVELDLVSDAVSRTSYFRLNTADIEPADVLARYGIVKAMEGAWWKITSGTEDASVAQVVAPDPRLLQMQTQSLRLLSDLGDDSIDGFRCRKLAVGIDPEKFAAYLRESAASEAEISQAQAMFETTDIVGEIWIDSRDHSIRKLLWSFSKKPDAPGSGTYSFEIALRLFDHNAAGTVTVPQNAREFSAEAIMSYGNDSPGAHSQGIADFDSMSDEEQDLFIKTFIDGEINTSR